MPAGLRHGLNRGINREWHKMPSLHRRHVDSVYRSCATAQHARTKGGGRSSADASTSFGANFNKAHNVGFCFSQIQ